MTGYGGASRILHGMQIQIDMKSVNHRYSEVSVRMPREWLMYEDLIKKTVLACIHRGRVDVFVTIGREDGLDKQVDVNLPLARQYIDAAHRLKDQLQIDGQLSITDVIKLPDVIALKETLSIPNEHIEAALSECSGAAVTQLMHMREAEGAQLYKDLLHRTDEMERLIAEIDRLQGLYVDQFREKLTKRLQDLLSDTTIDETRLMMEIALLAERTNIDEELTRLNSHRNQFLQQLQSEEPVGRKMDFLIQEMNREINTIGSKSNHQDIISLVVDTKAVLEKMREQVQNVE